jgi:DNA polymerase III delta subunit
VDLDARHAELLAQITGNSYDICMSECDKIKRYAQEYNVLHGEAMDALLKEGLIYRQEESTVFSFSESVMLKKFDEAVHEYSVLKSDGVDAVSILGTLYASMKNVLLVQVCENDDISGTTGLDSRQVYYAKKYVGRYTSVKLVEGLSLIADVVDKIKVGGIDEIYAVPYVLVSLC